MPCYDARDDDSRVIIQENTAELDKLTRLLCGVMTQLDKLDLSHRLDYRNRNISGLKTWWSQHQALDEKRITREQALAKLTKREREVLGL